MKNTRILIIEDEVLIAESIAALVEELGHEVVGFACTFSQALDSISQLDFNLALIDINLDEKDEGIELGQLLHEKKKPFIYLTSYSDMQTIEKAKVTQPDAYIIKPASKIDLFTNIEIAMERTSNDNNSEEQKIKVNNGHSTILLNPKDILWIKADRIYVEIKLKDQTFLQRTTFNDLMEQLEGTDIYRVHRSWAVNMNYLQGYSANQLVIEKTSIPISQTYKQQVKEKLNVDTTD